MPASRLGIRILVLFGLWNGRKLVPAVVYLFLCIAICHEGDGLIFSSAVGEELNWPGSSFSRLSSAGTAQRPYPRKSLFADQIADVFLGFINLHIEGSACCFEGLIGDGFPIGSDAHITHVMVIH